METWEHVLHYWHWRQKWAQCHGPIILSLESYKEQKREAIRDVIWPSCWNGRHCSKEYVEDYLSKILNIDHLINTQNRKKERKIITETGRGRWRKRQKEGQEKQRNIWRNIWRILYFLHFELGFGFWILIV